MSFGCDFIIAARAQVVGRESRAGLAGFVFFGDVRDRYVLAFWAGHDHGIAFLKGSDISAGADGLELCEGS